jgi:hypothetical protein
MSDLSPQNGPKQTLIRSGHRHESPSSGELRQRMLLERTGAHRRLRSRLTAIAIVEMVFEYLDWLLVQ